MHFRRATTCHEGTRYADSSLETFLCRSRVFGDYQLLPARTETDLFHEQGQYVSHQENIIIHSYEQGSKQGPLTSYTNRENLERALNVDEHYPSPFGMEQPRAGLLKQIVLCMRSMNACICQLLPK